MFSFFVYVKKYAHKNAKWPLSDVSLNDHYHFTYIICKYTNQVKNVKCNIFETVVFLIFEMYFCLPLKWHFSFIDMHKMKLYIFLKLILFGAFRNAF